MYTLCPHCDSVHTLTAQQLAADGGTVHCARCDNSFSALEHLYDDYPDKRRAADPEAAIGTPEVGRKPIPDIPAAPLEPPISKSSQHWPWTLAVAALALITVINLAWTFSEVIPPDSATARVLNGMGIPGYEPPAPFQDPSRIHLVTRDIHAHPTRSGVLVLSATFVNLAEQPQPYPMVSVILTNSDDQALAAREFRPADYLLQPPGEGVLLAPNTQVPLLLEFADPGERATGFEITFH